MEEHLTTPEGKASKLKELIYVTFALIALFSVVLFVLGFMFTLGFYSGAGALWGGEQNEHITVSYGFFSLLSLLPEFLKTVKSMLFSWQAFFGFISLLTGLVLLRLFVNQAIIDKVDSLYENKVISYSIVVLFLIWVVIMSFVRGKELATTGIEKLIEFGCITKDDGWNHCHQVWQNDKLIHEGYLVSKSANSLVMFKRDIQALEYIKLPKDAVLRRHFNANKTDSESSAEETESGGI